MKDHTGRGRHARLEPCQQTPNNECLQRRIDILTKVKQVSNYRTTNNEKAELRVQVDGTKATIVIINGDLDESSRINLRRAMLYYARITDKFILTKAPNDNE